MGVGWGRGRGGEGEKMDGGDEGGEGGGDCKLRRHAIY